MSANTKPRIEIEYCIQCGFLLRAAWLAQELLQAFPDEIGELVLKPGSGGVFIVRLEGEILFAREKQGRFPEAKELKQRVRDSIGSEKRFGHEER